MLRINLRNHRLSCKVLTYIFLSRRIAPSQFKGTHGGLFRQNDGVGTQQEIPKALMPLDGSNAATGSPPAVF